MSRPETQQSLIVMLGTDERTRGGISAVIGVLRRQGLFERWQARYIATHCDGSAWHKLVTAAHAWLAVTSLLVRGRVALIHIHTASGPSFWRKSMFVAAALVARVPYVLHVHGGGFSVFHDKRCGPLARRWIRSALGRACAVVVLSEEWCDTFERIAPGCRCVVIPNPVEIPDWSAALTEGPPTVVFLGRINETKGVPDLARAWPEVVAVIPEAQLVLAGSGDIERWRASFGASVQFPGWVSGADKAELLRRAWLFALPSHREALPMAILESMAAGIPVVATRVGGVALAVRDGETGLLIEPGDVAALGRALTGLLGDRQRRLDFGRAARQRAVEVFSAETHVRRIEQLWRKLQKE